MAEEPRGIESTVPQVLLGLGSNVGDRLAHLSEAVEHLSSHMRLLAASEVYETAPMYVNDQPPFYNAAALAETDLSPRELLSVLKGIESEIGRRASTRYGPREIDIDLLAYGRLSYRFGDGAGPKLQVPHSKIAERRFVLQPLADIAPDFRLPGLGVVSDLLDRTKEQSDSVRRTGHGVLSIHSKG